MRAAQCASVYGVRHRSDEVAATAAGVLSFPPPRLLRRSSASTYRAGDALLRVSSAPSVQTIVVPILAEAGIPVARPLAAPLVIGDYEVTAWEWLTPTPEALDARALGAAIVETARF